MIDHWTTEGFDDAQAQAIRRIKESIDRGVAAVVWAPTILEFGLVVGYDDADGVFFVDDVGDPDPDPLLYSNLGKNHSMPWLHCQVFESEPGTVDLRDACREALAYGLDYWRRGSIEFRSNPSNRPITYPVGRAGYDATVAILDERVADPFGLRYILWVNADGRRLVRDFLARVVDDDIVPRLEDTVALYDGVAARLWQVHELIPCGDIGAQPEPAAAREAIDLLRDALPLEDRAMEIISTAVDAAPARPSPP